MKYLELLSACVLFISITLLCNILLNRFEFKKSVRDLNKKNRRDES